MGCSLSRCEWKVIFQGTLTPSGEEVEVLWLDFALIFLIAFIESIFYRYPFQIFILGRISQDYGPFKSAGNDWLDNLWILEPSNLGWPFISMYEHWVHQPVKVCLRKMNAVFLIFFFISWRHIHVWFGQVQLFLSSMCFNRYITIFLCISKRTRTYSHPPILSSQMDQPFSNASPLCILPMSLRPQRFWFECFNNGH